MHYSIDNVIRVDSNSIKELQFKNVIDYLLYIDYLSSEYSFLINDLELYIYDLE